MIRIVRVAHILHDLFADLLRYIVVDRFEGTNGTIEERIRCRMLFIVVLNFIEGGNIHAGNFCDGMQDLRTALLFGAHRFIEIHDLVVTCLALAHVEEVKERGQGLRIIGAGTAANYDRVVLATVFCIDRNARQIQDLEDIRITHFVLQGDP